MVPTVPKLCLFIAVACTALAAACSEQDWTVSPDFAGEGARFEISGAACSGKVCLAVNDEEDWAQTFAIDGRRIVPDKRVRLLPKGSGEIDAEAVAVEDGVFYIAGSHGLARKTAKFRDSQFLVFRWQPGSQEVESSDRLREIIANAPGIGPFAERPLGENGANIEGMAVDNGRLFVGFRGPNVEGTAFILEIGVDALFGETAASPVIHEVLLDADIGIRDMVKAPGGFLLLTGPVNDDPRVQSIAFWRSGTPPKTLAILKPVEGGKAETLLVLEESGGTIRLLILYDSLRNGAPREIEVEL